MAQLLALVLIVIATIIGCADLPAYYGRLDRRAALDVATAVDGSGTLAAFYATNRAAVPGGANAVQRYGVRRGGMSYGVADVRVPHGHTIGDDPVTRAASRALGRAAEAPLEVTAVSESADDAAFLAALKAAVDATPRKDLIVFVHGYNNSFAGSVAGTATLAYDLGRPMVPLTFAWVSQGTYQGYTVDEDHVDDAARDLAALLARVTAAMPSGTRVHLVAHSMGARVVTGALLRWKAAQAPTDPPKPLENLVFAAPDVAADEFRRRLQDDGLAAMAERTTLYVAWNDRALDASQRVHGYRDPRAGRAGDRVLVIPGVDTVDVSLNDASAVGHGYHGDNRAVLTDLHMLLALDQPPERRNLFRVQGRPGLWLIRP